MLIVLRSAVVAQLVFCPLQSRQHWHHARICLVGRQPLNWVCCCPHNSSSLGCRRWACRLAWSPDGRYLTAVNCYENSHHAAILLERGSWAPADTDAALKMMGHKAAVLVARYNPKMFRSAHGRTNGTRPAPDLCLALGSQASLRCVLCPPSWHQKPAARVGL